MADEDRTDAFCTSTLGLIGDFGDTYKRAVKDELMQEWVQSAIAYGRQRGSSKSAKSNAAYAQKVSLICLGGKNIADDFRLSRISQDDSFPFPFPPILIPIPIPSFPVTQLCKMYQQDRKLSI